MDIQSHFENLSRVAPTSPFCSSAKKSNQSTDQTRAPDWLVFGTEGVSSFYDMMMMMMMMLVMMLMMVMLMMLMMISIGALWECREKKGVITLFQKKDCGLHL